MREKILLLAITFFNLLSKFWKIGQIPPMLNPESLSLRYLSALLSSILPILLYFLIVRKKAGKKMALLTALIYSLLPAAIVEGRIASPLNSALLLLLFFLLAGVIPKNIFIRLGLITSYPVLFLLIYPQIWLLNNPVIISPQKFINNLFNLLSFELLFFRNITFYWGGVREVGVIYFSLLPFFLSGIYYSLIKPDKKIIFPLALIIVFSSLSPLFPEVREFYLSLPFFAIILARGILTVWQKRKSHARVLLVFLFPFFLYEVIYFFHIYSVHYPQQIKSNMAEIKGPF